MAKRIPEMFFVNFQAWLVQVYLMLGIDQCVEK